MNDLRNTPQYKKMWVCFRPPSNPLPPHTLILSFLSPLEETAFPQDDFISGRKTVLEYREKAQKLYIELITKPPATPCVGGKTLREVLKGSRSVSRWWYHPTSVKSSVETDTPYTSFSRIVCINEIAKKYDIQEIHLSFPPPFIAECLKQKFQVTTYGSETPSFWKQMFRCGRSLMGRGRFLYRQLLVYFLLREKRKELITECDVVFQGFWNWSFHIGNKIEDQYFRQLPKILKERYQICWLARLVPLAVHGKEKPTLKWLIHKSCEFPEVLLVESFYNITDILRATIDVRPFFHYLRFLYNKDYRDAFREDQIDFFPLWSIALFQGFLGLDIAEMVLVEQGSIRAFQRTSPKVFATFLEFFLSRPMYAAADTFRGAIPTVCMQHALYAKDKIFGRLDNDLEKLGHPDQCAMPLPKRLFVMGKNDQYFFQESGYSEKNVPITGGLRYEKIPNIYSKIKLNDSKEINILLIAGFNESADSEMCEAIITAASGIGLVKIRFRDHPYHRMSSHPKFHSLSPHMEVSHYSAYEDIMWSNLVIFTHSSMAEECLIRGRPVWKWVYAGVNSTALLDLKAIPLFYTIADLKSALTDFQKNPYKYIPTLELRKEISHLFYSENPDTASKKIAEEIEKTIA